MTTPRHAWLDAGFFLIRVSEESIKNYGLHIVESLGLVMSKKPTKEEVCKATWYGITFQRPCDGKLVGFLDAPEITRFVKQEVCFPTGEMRRSASSRYGLDQLDPLVR